MNAKTHHPVLATLSADLSAAAGGNFGDPTLQVIGGTFLVAVLFAAGGAIAMALVRRSSGVESSSMVLKRGGLVDVSHFRSIDVMGVVWLVVIYAWLSMARIAAAGVVEQERVMGIADLWVSIGFHCVMAGMVIFVMSPRVRVDVWLGLGWQRGRSLMLLAPVSVMAMWLVYGLLETAGYVKWIESLGVETVQDSVRALQKVDDAAFLALMRFSAIVVAPICEEVIFRGYLYGVAKRYCGPIAAALGSALIFSAAHTSLVALLPLALFGLVLVWLYERTGSLWTPIAAHACFNALTVVQLMMR